MSEYEIFNGGDNIEIVPEPKKRKEKVVKEKKECDCNFFEEAFSLKNLPLSLAIISMFFAFFVRFLPLVSFSLGALITAGIFMFISFSAVFSAIIIESIMSIKNKTFKFNMKILVIILAFLFICI